MNAKLEDALVRPARREDLVVRIGGYSTRFNWLTPKPKREMIKRTEYAL